MEPGPPVRQFLWEYRLRQEGPERVLQSLDNGVWQDMYAFTLEEALPVDFAMANYYTSTYPNSPFVRGLRVQRQGREMRLYLLNRQISEVRGAERRETLIEGDATLLDVLAERFGLVLPPGTRFRCLDQAE